LGLFASCLEDFDSWIRNITLIDDIWAFLEDQTREWIINTIYVAILTDGRQRDVGVNRDRCLMLKKMKFDAACLSGYIVFVQTSDGQPVCRATLVCILIFFKNVTNRTVLVIAYSQCMPRLKKGWLPLVQIIQSSQTQILLPTKLLM
jgi:hypothetical protein